MDRDVKFILNLINYLIFSISLISIIFEIIEPEPFTLFAIILTGCIMYIQIDHY